jgi:hypothetical protein
VEKQRQYDARKREIGWRMRNRTKMENDNDNDKERRKELVGTPNTKV